MAIVMLSEIICDEFSWFFKAFNTGVGYFENNCWYTWLQIYNDVLISKVMREITTKNIKTCLPKHCGKFTQVYWT